MNKIATYKNGNYVVTIYDDGTKIRENDGDILVPDFAESVDITITNRCDGGCRFCYQGCTPEGKHGEILNRKFLDTLHPYTEIAIGGNDLSHPDLMAFLYLMKKKNVIVNMTVNQKHFMNNYAKISKLIDDKLVYGLGISMTKATPEFIKRVQKLPNAVIHVINGVVKMEDLFRLFNRDLKILILGYKKLGRGKEYYKDNIVLKERQRELYHYLPDIISCFKVVSFDNLALRQLSVRDLMSDEEWNEFYMGDDAQYTFYIDLVNGYFAKSSLDMEEHYPLMDSIDDMFQFIREKYDDRAEIQS